MKRTLLVILALALVLVSFACSKKEESAKPEETIAEEQTVLETEKIIEETTVAPTDQPEEPSEEVTGELSEEPTEEPLKEPDDKTIVIGKPIQFDDFEMVITELKVVDTWNDKYALRITYDWTNTGNKEEIPSLTFIFKGFQNKVSSDSLAISDDVDLEPGQKTVKPGGKITGAHDAVAIDDINAPLLLELTKLLTWDYDEVYSLEIEDLNEYK